MGLKVIIPTAGKGTRLRPYTYSTPKVLLHVAGKPVLGHLLDSLLYVMEMKDGLEIEELIIVHGYLGERVIEYVDSYMKHEARSMKIEVTFVKQEEEIGLGHAVYLCRDRFLNEPVLILLGDTIFEVDYSSAVQSNCVGVKTLEDPRRFGIVETRNGFVSKVVEKPKEMEKKMVLIGLYFFEHSKPLFEVLNEMVQNHQSPITNHQSPKEWWQGEIQFTDCLQRLTDQGVMIRPIEIEGWYDCGTPEALLETNRHLLENQLPHPPSGYPNFQFPNSEIIPPVSIHPDVKIEGSKIGPYVSIGRGVTIKDAVLSDVIVNEGATVAGARSRLGGMPLQLKNRIVGENERIVNEK